MVRIYALVNSETNEIRYIGKTISRLDKRLSKHISDANKKTYKSKWIKSLIAKGIKPSIILIEETSDTEWVEAEQFWIAYFMFLGARLANLTRGGEGSLGYKASEKTKEKLSIAAKGKPCPEHVKKYLSQIRKGNKNALGAKRSDAFKEGVSKRCKGVKITKEHSEKLSRLRKNKPWSELQRLRYNERTGIQDKIQIISDAWRDGNTLKDICKQHGVTQQAARKAMKAIGIYDDARQSYHKSYYSKPETYEKMYANRAK